MRFLVTCLLVMIASTASIAVAENRLAGMTSPYLRQHASNPVDWYPYGPEALEKARAENKMIFVSVGYASCHWCHVMEEQSFENEAIAAFLNQHFVSIKIDRERRPDLDEQFVLVTSALTGNSGWPNSVFMTPEGDPFYAGTYFPPDIFQGNLSEITTVWQTENTALRREAAGISLRLRNYLDQRAVLGRVTSAQINAAATSMLSQLDNVNGGFGTAPKFPNENVLLFLMDQAERTGDTVLLRAVTLTLDGMIKGGIHDHVGGGFHRYGTDPEWKIPHFEKMLYNQALIGRVLLRAYSATGNSDYANAARRVFDYVLRDMTAPEGGFYGAEDADSFDQNGHRVEGAFYIWTRDQIRAVLGDASAPVIQHFNVQDEGAIEGANILNLSVSSSITGVRPEDLEKLRLNRASRSAPPKDRKIVLAWNGEMIATLAEASQVLNQPEYGKAAARAAVFLAGEMRTKAGLNRIWFEGQADVGAQLPDYAAFGRAMLALDDYLGHGNWLARADALADELIEQFADEGRALRMNAQAVGLGQFRPLDDSEVASGNAQALALLAGLDRRLARRRAIATNLAGALALEAVAAPGRRAATLVALSAQRDGQTGPMRVSDGGAVRVFAQRDDANNQLKLQVKLRQDWHINAYEPLEDYLIGLRLTINDVALDGAAYPMAIVQTLGFSDKPLSLYDADFTLTVPMPKGNLANQVSLRLQACNDQVCLPPDTMVFRFW